MKTSINPTPVRCMAVDRPSKSSETGDKFRIGAATQRLNPIEQLTHTLGPVCPKAISGSGVYTSQAHFTHSDSTLKPLVKRFQALVLYDERELKACSEIDTLYTNHNRVFETKIPGALRHYITKDADWRNRLLEVNEKRILRGKNPYSFSSMCEDAMSEYEQRKQKQRQHLSDWSFADPKQVEGIREAIRKKQKELKNALFRQRNQSVKLRQQERRKTIPPKDMVDEKSSSPKVEIYKINKEKLRESRRKHNELDRSMRIKKRAVKKSRRVHTEARMSDGTYAPTRNEIKYLKTFVPFDGGFNLGYLNGDVIHDLLETCGLTSVWQILGTKAYGDIDVAQILMSVMSFAIQMSRAESQLDIGLAISQLQIGLGVPMSGRDVLLASAMMSFPARLFLKNKEKQNIHTESLTDLKEMKPSEVISAIASNFGLLLTSDLVAQLKRIIMSAVSFKLFDKDLSKQLVMALGPAEKMSMIDFVGLTLEGLVAVLRVYESIRFDSVPIHEALFSGDPIMKLHNEVVDLLDYKDRLYTGLPVAGKMCQKEYLSKVRHHKVFAEKLKAQYSPTTKRYTTLNRLCLMLVIAERDVLTMIAGRRRHAPFGICLHGLPGIGKSKILTYLAHIWSQVKGRKFDDGQIYNRMLNSDYWDGHDPPSQPYIHYSEVGRQAYNIIKNTGDAVIDELTSLMDSLPMLLNVAFEGKGKVPACPELILIDTNNPDMNVSVCVNNAAALERRLAYLEPKVKRQFLKDDGCGIDYAKSMAAEGDPMDRWTFRLVLKTPVSVKKSRDIVLMDHDEDDDIFKLTRIMVDLYTKHIESESRLHDLFTNEETYGSTYNTAVPTLTVAVTESRVLLEKMMPIGEYFGKWKTELYTTMAKDSWKYASKVMNTAWTFFFLMMISAFLYTTRKCVCNFKYENHFGTRFKVAVSSITVLILSALLRDWLYRHWMFTIFSVLVIYMLDIPQLIMTFMSVEMEVRQQVYWERAKTQMYRLMRELGIVSMKNVFWNPSLVMGASSFALIIGAITTIIITVKTLIKSNPSFRSEGHTVMRKDSPLNERLNSLEEGFHCGNSYKRIKLKEHKLWNVQTAIANVVFTGTVGQMYRSLASNIRRCKIVSTVTLETYVFGVASDLALINVHSFAGKIDGSVVCVSSTGSLDPEETTWYRTQVQESQCVRFGSDMMLLRLSGVRFRDRVKFFAEKEEFLDAANAMIGNESTRAYKGVEPLVVDDANIGQITLKDYWQYNWSSHRSGFCGTPVTIELGNGAAICGIHTAGAEKGHTGFCEAVYRKDLERAIKQLESKRVTLPIMSEGRILDDVEDPTPKSPFVYEHLPGLEYYGKLKGEVMLNNKSRLRKTPFAAKMTEALFDEFGFVTEEKYGPPIMKPVTRNGEYLSPYNIALKSMVKDTPALDQVVLDKIILELTDRFTTKLEEKGVTKLSPLTIEAAINGVNFDPFLKRINCSTSSGFGWDGTKAKYLEIVDDSDNVLVREPVDELKVRLADCLDSYARGETANFVYSAQLKDEPRAQRKVKEGKTRVFYMTPLEALILNRMFLYPFYSLMVEFADIFCTAVGINTHSGSDEFVKTLLAFSKWLFEADVKNFDLSIPYDIHLAFRTVVYKVLKKMGYTEKALKIVVGLLTDNLFIFIAMNKDFFKVAGIQPSGKYATAEDNSGVLLVFLMYIWYCLTQTKNHDFFTNVLPRTYGDDLLAAIAEAFKDIFNAATIAEFAKSKMGVTITAASKGDVEVPIISIHEASFLKRSFVFRDGKWIMPLDKESFTKMMMWYIPSKSVTKEKQLSDTCCSCLWELFFHTNAQEHERWRVRLATWMQEDLSVPYEESLNIFPTWVHIQNSLY